MKTPDPVVQNPSMPLSYNRTAYVYNNPLKYTDPSGYQSMAATRNNYMNNHQFLTSMDYEMMRKNSNYGGGGGSPSPSAYFKRDENGDWVALTPASRRLSGKSFGEGCAFVTVL